MDALTTTNPEVLSPVDRTDFIKLPEEAVRGLSTAGILEMKNTAVNVNQAWEEAGRQIRNSSQILWRQKRGLKRGNWTAFINSGVLNISAKTASDLVNAYDKWLVEDEEVPDSLLSTMSPRTLSAVANSEADIRNVILSKVISAAKTSEADIRKIIKEATPNRKSLQISKKEEKSAEEKLNQEFNNGTKETFFDKLNEARFRIVIKDKKIGELEKKIEELLKEVNASDVKGLQLLREELRTKGEENDRFRKQSAENYDLFKAVKEELEELKEDK